MLLPERLRLDFERFFVMRFCLEKLAPGVIKHGQVMSDDAGVEVVVAQCLGIELEQALANRSTLSVLPCK